MEPTRDGGGAMAVPRVLVLFHNQLFGQAVRAILEQAGAIEVVGIRPCWQVTVEGIRSLAPNVIIAERERANPPGGCAMEMAEFMFAGEVPGVRVIFLSLENGRARVCDSWYLQDVGRDELLEVILGPVGSAGNGDAGPAVPREGGDAKGG